jgi:hypothetical protein
VIIAVYSERMRDFLSDLGCKRTGISRLAGRGERYESGALHLVRGFGHVPCDLFTCTKEETSMLGRELGPTYTLTKRGCIHVYV